MKPYGSDGTWMIGENQPRYSNRCLFCANSDTFILAGDKPVIRFAKRRCVLGTLRFFAHGKPLDECQKIVTRFRAAQSVWEIEDPAFAGRVAIDLGSPQGKHAMVVRVSAPEGLTVTVQYGGVHYAGDGVFSVSPDFEGNYAAVPFDPAHKGETYTPAEGGFDVSRPEADKYLAERFGAPARLCLRADFPLRVEDGLAMGEIEGRKLICVSLCAENESPLGLTEARALAVHRAEYLNSRLRVRTPDPTLDFACAYESNYQDGIWYPPRNVHSAAMWNVPYLGWTNRYGNDVLAWHDRTLAELRFYQPYQVTDDEKQGAKIDISDRLGTLPGPDTRFFGKGHVDQDQYMYNMQTQFFDQAIHSWRMTGDPEMQKILYPMLKLHTLWQDECFDPDGDGAYESVVNTWPTDSVWYNGGGSPEETCYAYRAHEAVRDMARIEGDKDEEEKQNDILARIKRGFFDVLWCREKGVAGAYREQGGYGRLHENPWSYAAFLPVDMGLLTPIQAAQSLHYTRWALENEKTSDGRVVYHSNWVPEVWSVRWRGGYEQYMLAQAFFKAGFPEDGVALLNGALHKDSASEKVDDVSRSSDPNLASDGARAVLEGLFGYRPDYPNNRVDIAPSFPFDWKNAEIVSDDVSLIYKRGADFVSLEYALARRAEVYITLPVYARELLSVEGGDLDERLPGFGRKYARVAVGASGRGKVTLRLAGETAPVLPREIEAACAGYVMLRCAGKARRVLDPQGVCEEYFFSDAGVESKIRVVSGQKIMFVESELGDGTIYESFHLNVGKTPAEIELFERSHPALPENPRYEILNLTPNADAESIYREKYVSPRPETVSARIGADGYSPWTFPYWKNHAPELALEKRGAVYTRDGAPLTVLEGEKNVAFASLWDNFPDRVSIPAGRITKMALVHLCGTTNPMQCGIENARLIFVYEDGAREVLPVVNPDNFWSLCELAAMPSADGQGTINDYSYESSAFCLPEIPPETLQLGKNMRSVVLRWKTRPDATLVKIDLEVRSQEVVIGLLGATLVM